MPEINREFYSNHRGKRWIAILACFVVGLIGIPIWWITISALFWMLTSNLKSEDKEVPYPVLLIMIYFQVLFFSLILWFIGWGGRFLISLISRA